MPFSHSVCLAVRLELAAEEGREKRLDRGPRGGQCQVGKDGGGAEVEGGAEEVGGGGGAAGRGEEWAFVADRPRGEEDL